MLIASVATPANMHPVSTSWQTNRGSWYMPQGCMQVGHVAVRGCVVVCFPHAILHLLLDFFHARCKAHTVQRLAASSFRMQLEEWCTFALGTEPVYVRMC